MHNNVINLFLCLILTVLFSYINSKYLRYANYENEKRILNTNSNLQIEFPQCKSDTDCSGHGSCLEGFCLCDKKYVTYVDLKEINKKYMNDSSVEINVKYEGKVCNYKLKDQLTAFMISFFVGFGSEHFYMENYGVGAGKLVLALACFYLNIFFFIGYFTKLKSKLDFIGLSEGIYCGIGFFLMMCWNLYDWVKIGMNQMKDGNGFLLYSWNNDE